ncbi:DUF4247 domain-containing protein [Bacillus tianshenii]|nr:DUF4247 domain-containing protein [Bacillus tianshenii]
MLRKLGILMASLMLVFVAACGGNENVVEQSEPELFDSSGQSVKEQQSALLQYVDKNYEFVEIINSSVNNNDVSKVYRATDKSIDQVATELQEQAVPREISERQNDKQVLIYDNPRLFVILTQDENEPANTMVELAEYPFVRDNFSPSFFDGLFVLWFLDEVLDVDDWGKRQKKRCYEANNNCYRGYSTTGGSYIGPSKKPSFRGYSSSVRGGGPGAGK